MSKKDFSNALKNTAAAQKQVIEDRFTKADSMLLQMERTSFLETSNEVLATAIKTDPLIRDTFSMPAIDHSLIEKIRMTAAKDGFIANKSEVIRAGLKVLSNLNREQLMTIFSSLEKIKPGRK
jgi:hypothetical protein